MADKGKKILILGNGFDLAHGLPTKYSHFLEFCERVEMLWSYKLNRMNVAEFKRAYIDNWEINESISAAIVTAYENIEIFRDGDGEYMGARDYLELAEIHTLLDDNVWYEYFLELYITHCIQGENWIDFESEIRFIIKEMDEKSLSLTEYWGIIRSEFDPPRDSKLITFDGKLKFYKYFQRKKWTSDHQITIRDFREKAFYDLERLTRVLELYLVEFVEKIPINDSKKIPEISSLNPDYVINFNYTDTYERIYKKGKVYHIHGKADAERSAEENNMVLGIDEYWLGDERDERTNFTIFKKFAQRIQKHTGNENYKYLEEIQKIFKEKGNKWSGNGDISKDHPDGVSYVYVFGHSLDVTDKDILSSFIGDDSTSVIVYCMDKATEGELIANTIKLISEKKLLDKSYHIPTKLEYVIPKKTNKF